MVGLKFAEGSLSSLWSMFNAITYLIARRFTYATAKLDVDGFLSVSSREFVLINLKLHKSLKWILLTNFYLSLSMPNLLSSILICRRNMSQIKSNVAAFR